MPLKSPHSTGYLDRQKLHPAHDRPFTRYHVVVYLDVNHDAVAWRGRRTVWNQNREASGRYKSLVYYTSTVRAAYLPAI